MTSTWLARVAYIGAQLRNLLANREINPAVNGPGASLSNINQRRPYFPNYSSVVQFEATSRSDYHAVAFSTEKRLSDGYALSASYTWSQSKDNGGAVVAGGAGASTRTPTIRTTTTTTPTSTARTASSGRSCGSFPARDLPTPPPGTCSGTGS